jgi:hypothetical protein
MTYTPTNRKMIAEREREEYMRTWMQSGRCTGSLTGGNRKSGQLCNRGHRGGVLDGKRKGECLPNRQADAEKDASYTHGNNKLKSG